MWVLFLSLLRSGKLSDRMRRELELIQRVPALPFPAVDPSAARRSAVPRRLLNQWRADELHESELIAANFAREYWSLLRLVEQGVSLLGFLALGGVALILPTSLWLNHDAFAGALLTFAIAGSVSALLGVAWVRFVRSGAAMRTGAVAWAAHAMELTGASSTIRTPGAASMADAASIVRATSAARRVSATGVASRFAPARITGYASTVDISGGWRRIVRLVVGMLLFLGTVVLAPLAWPVVMSIPLEFRPFPIVVVAVSVTVLTVLLWVGGTLVISAARRLHPGTKHGSRRH